MPRGLNRIKDPSAVMNQRGGRMRSLTVLEDLGVVVKAPRAPRGLGNYAQAIWRAFWLSRAAQAVDLNTDGDRLRHWIQSVDERETLTDLATKQPLIRGSHGQLMLNPLFRRIRELTRDIEQTEDAFGMTPLSRFRLNFTFVQARQSVNMGVVDEYKRRLAGG